MPTSTMPQKMIFLATHPRSCSTAFERVMMTRSSDALVCIHELFGDAFYYGPERMGERFLGDSGEAVRAGSGFEDVTFGDVVERNEGERKEAEKENKRIFIKDIAHYLLSPNPKTPARIPPSLRLGIHKRKGYGTNGVVNGDTTNGDLDDLDDLDEDAGNPTVLPLRILRNYQFTFLIRHPRQAVPSYYRCCIPPLSADTGFHSFIPSEAGYRELRELFDFLRAKGLVTSEDLCVVDADDLLDRPREVMRRYCACVGLDFRESMLGWGTDREGCGKFDKWKGFHNDAIESAGLKPRERVRRVPPPAPALRDGCADGSYEVKKHYQSEEEEYEAWVEKYGREGADLIRDTVKANLEDYEYLRQFKIEVQTGKFAVPELGARLKL